MRENRNSQARMAGLPPKDGGGARRVQGGIATSDAILSAHAGGNANVFPKILRLHVPEGSIVADVTYGNGVFWRNVEPGLYDVRATDIADGVDCRAPASGTRRSGSCIWTPARRRGGFCRRTES